MFSVMREDEFPGGVQCPGCFRDLKDGDPYKTVLEELYEGMPVETVMCVYCSLEDIIEVNSSAADCCFKWAYGELCVRCGLDD